MKKGDVVNVYVHPRRGKVEDLIVGEIVKVNPKTVWVKIRGDRIIKRRYRDIGV